MTPLQPKHFITEHLLERLQKITRQLINERLADFKDKREFIWLVKKWGISLPSWAFSLNNILLSHLNSSEINHICKHKIATFRRRKRTVVYLLIYEVRCKKFLAFRKRFQHKNMSNYSSAMLFWFPENFFRVSALFIFFFLVSNFCLAIRIFSEVYSNISHRGLLSDKRVISCLPS